MNARIDRAETVFLGPLASPEAERRTALAYAGAEAWQARMLARLHEATVGWLERVRARRELAGLTDRELADIGITRGDIDSVTR